jgi:hypothetical protein
MDFLGFEFTPAGVIALFSGAIFAGMVLALFAVGLSAVQGGDR